MSDRPVDDSPGPPTHIANRTWQALELLTVLRHVVHSRGGLNPSDDRIPVDKAALLYDAEHDRYRLDITANGHTASVVKRKRFFVETDDAAGAYPFPHYANRRVATWLRRWFVRREASGPE